MKIDVLPVIEKIKEEIEEHKKKLNRKPKLISITDDYTGATKAYLKSQKRISKEYDIDFEVIETENLIETVKKFNDDKSVDGIFIARPTKTIKFIEVAKVLNPIKDVEGVTPYNMGMNFYGIEEFVPCTAESAVKILEYVEDLKSKKVAVIGRSITVGKPLAIMLENYGRDCTVNILNSKTKNIQEITKNSDIVVVAIGRANYVDMRFLKEGTTVIDVGINVVDGKLTGDVSKDVEKYCSVTPVPGGVGSVTSAILMRNVFRAAVKGGKK